jgi:hypothetical protein
MNLKETIRKILMEQNIPSTSNELIKSLPEGLKKLFFNQWKAKQNPKWHPEGNTLKHIIVVLNRAYTHYPDDPNMIMAALFHDLGKSDTYKINPKTGQPTAYGHEDVSTKYVEEFKDWIESFNGTDVDEIKYLVKNHMKVKPNTWDAMRDIKKEPIEKHPAFDKLMGFTDKLDGGGTEIRKSIKEAIKEVVNESEMPASIRRRIKMDKYLEKLRDEDKKKGEQTEGLHDTSWENDGQKITLVDLLDVTEDIPVKKLSVKKLKPHLLTWDDDEEEIKKIEKADLKYPILIFVNDKGGFISIIDGHHRAQKAVRKGLRTIKGKLIPINSLPNKMKKVFGHMGKQEQNEQELTEKCWKGYTQKGMKTMFGKRYPNCVKKTK